MWRQNKFYSSVSRESTDLGTQLSISVSKGPPKIYSSWEDTHIWLLRNKQDWVTVILEWCSFWVSVAVYLSTIQKVLFHRLSFLKKRASNWHPIIKSNNWEDTYYLFKYLVLKVVQLWAMPFFCYFYLCIYECDLRQPRLMKMKKDQLIFQLISSGLKCFDYMFYGSVVYKAGLTRDLKFSGF